MWLNRFLWKKNFFLAFCGKNIKFPVGNSVNKVYEEKGQKKYCGNLINSENLNAELKEYGFKSTFHLKNICLSAFNFLMVLRWNLVNEFQHFSSPEDKFFCHGFWLPEALLTFQVHSNHQIRWLSFIPSTPAKLESFQPNKNLMDFLSQVLYSYIAVYFVKKFPFLYEEK